MLRVLRGDTTGELMLAGTPPELPALGQLLRSGTGEMNLSKVADPSPYDRSLSQIKCRKSERKLVITFRGDDNSLGVQGSLEFLIFFAEIIEDWAEADPSDHLHVDYWADHDYLDRESQFLVIKVDSQLRVERCAE
jgi:hypothetical protein